MKRRSFLKFLGLAPAAPLAVKGADVARRIEEAVALPIEPEVPIYTASEPADGYMDGMSMTVTCCTIVTGVYIQGRGWVAK